MLAFIVPSLADLSVAQLAALGSKSSGGGGRPAKVVKTKSPVVRNSLLDQNRTE